MKYRIGMSLLLFVLLLCGLGCNSTNNGSSGSGNSGMNMAGVWTVTAVSTEGNGTFSGTATLQQSGQGLGISGVTTLTAAVGSVTFTQSDTSLTGTLTDSIKNAIYNFTGTLSSGNLTITGAAIPCGGGGIGTQSANITGTITSTSGQGSYTIMRSGCYYLGDSGTWTATKQ
jgi:hypothetical protein